MYTIFVNDAKIVLVSNRINCLNNQEVFYQIDEVRLSKVIDKLYKGTYKTVYLYHSNKDKGLKKIKKMLTVVVAAGGVVKNPDGKILFIYRNKKWDLPKGKLNKNETIEEAAIREVQEETGVLSTKIEHFIACTYHIFKVSKKYRLKEVHWYSMRSDYCIDVRPQREEGITKVVWKDADKLSKLFEKTYPSIKILMNNLGYITN